MTAVNTFMPDPDGAIRLGQVRFWLINAGEYYSDAGAALGVLPKAIWQKQVKTDDQGRCLFALCLLLVESAGKYLLVDAGIGPDITPKMAKIYKPSTWRLDTSLAALGLTRGDVDYVAFTHLHFDHAGGACCGSPLKPAFAKARYLVEHSEWDIAKTPDLLNQAAYNYQSHLEPLATSGQLQLFSGSYMPMPGVELICTGGHSNGFCAVRLSGNNQLAWYPADLIPHRLHIMAPVTSAYDVSRTVTFSAKQMILKQLINAKGLLLLNHDPDIAALAWDGENWQPQKI